MKEYGHITLPNNTPHEISVSEGAPYGMHINKKTTCFFKLLFAGNLPADSIEGSPYDIVHPHTPYGNFCNKIF